MICARDCLMDSSEKKPWDKAAVEWAHSECLRKAEALLKQGSSVIVHNQFQWNEHVKPYIRMAAKYKSVIQVGRMRHFYGERKFGIAKEVLQQQRNCFEIFEDKEVALELDLQRKKVKHTLIDCKLQGELYKVEQRS